MIRFCANCGNQLHNDDLSCPRCGNIIPEITQDAPTGVLTKPKAKKTISLVLLIVIPTFLVLVGFLIIGLLFWKPIASPVLSKFFPEQYLKLVASNSIEVFADRWSDSAMGTLLDATEYLKDGTITTDLTIGDKSWSTSTYISRDSFKVLATGRDDKYGVSTNFSSFEQDLNNSGLSKHLSDEQKDSWIQKMKAIEKLVNTIDVKQTRLTPYLDIYKEHIAGNPLTVTNQIIELDGKDVQCKAFTYEIGQAKTMDFLISTLSYASQDPCIQAVSLPGSPLCSDLERYLNDIISTQSNGTGRYSASSTFTIYILNNLIVFIDIDAEIYDMPTLEATSITLSVDCTEPTSNKKTLFDLCILKNGKNDFNYQYTVTDNKQTASYEFGGYIVKWDRQAGILTFGTEIYEEYAHECILRRNKDSIHFQTNHLSSFFFNTDNEEYDLLCQQIDYLNPSLSVTVKKGNHLGSNFFTSLREINPADIDTLVNMLHTKTDKLMVFLHDPIYQRVVLNSREVYKHQKWSRLGFEDYVDYTTYLNDIANLNGLTEDEKASVKKLGATAIDDNALAAKYVKEFTQYYKSKGYTVVRLEGKFQLGMKKYKEGGTPYLFAYRDTLSHKLLLQYAICDAIKLAD